MYSHNFPFSDPVCRTMSIQSAKNPDANQKCSFSEDKNNTYKICSKIEDDDDAFWCPTKGWSKNKDSKKGICNDNCDKENGKNELLFKYDKAGND